MGQKIDLTSQVQGILPPINGGAGASAGVQFVDAEIPSGPINGSNGVFSLANVPNPAASLLLFLNRQLQIQGVDYTLVGNTITIAAPAGGSILRAWYRFINLGTTLFLSDSLSISDAFVFDVPTARLPLSVVDSLSMADIITMVLSPFPAAVITEFLLMTDSVRVSLAQLAESFSDSLTLSDGFVVKAGIPKVLTDNMASYVDDLIYMFAATGNGSSIYVTDDVMRMTDGPVVVLVDLETFAEQMTQSDAITIQLR